jgi:Fe2+ transport system protein FeoA
MQRRARPLTDLRPGEGGTIHRLSGVAETRHRLLEMGLTCGTPVRVVRTAPLGDPIELHVRGYRLGLRRAEAANVLVERD